MERKPDSYEKFENVQASSPCKAVAIVEKNTNEQNTANIKEKYRRKEKGYMLYARLYLVFFFLGGCLIAYGNINSIEYGEKLNEIFLGGINTFSDFCHNFFIFVIGSFAVYASGFTVYGALVSSVFSSFVFFSCGVFATSMVAACGADVVTFGSLVVIGIFCVITIVFCSVSRGISDIAINGIYSLAIFDGLLFTAVYFVTVFAQYYAIRGVSALVELYRI